MHEPTSPARGLFGEGTHPHPRPMKTLRIDIETFSDFDLPKCGVHRYVESPEFQILLFGFAYDDEPVSVVDLIAGEPIPAQVLSDLEDQTVIKKAYNASFEITCLSRHLGRPLDPAQWRCTSVHALYLGLPGNLADVGRVVGLKEDAQKLNGWSLIRYFCLPCKPTKVNGGRSRNLPHHDPEKWKLLKEYCQRDVEVERDIARKLKRFDVPQIEQDLWVLDQQMNTAGIAINSRMVLNAIELESRVKERLTREAIELTGLDNPSSRPQLLEWLQEVESEDITDIKKATIPKLLESTNSDLVRRVLELRQELGKTSVKKYAAMARAVCADSSLRGLMQFYGANRSGRWSSRLVQVQNLPKNTLSDIDLARNLLIDGDFETLEMLFGNVPDTLSQLIRTAFVARDGHKFLVVDFNAIEARVVAWLAWCQWRLDVFATHGRIYEASAEQMFKLPAGSVTKKSPYRNRGKISELALGYGGGANALKAMGALEMGLAEDELEQIKTAWRNANPEIVQFWYACENAAISAVRGQTEVTIPIADAKSALVFTFESRMLTIQLPSGRKLFYVKPRIETQDLIRQANGGEYVAAREGSLTYEGMDQGTRKWQRIATWGGKLVENITQAIARDCLRESLLTLSAHGFKPLTTIHDEIVLEEPINGPRDVAAAERLMGRSINWAPGLPLQADGFETPYYMKEAA